MKESALGFIGGGRVTRIFLEGLRSTGLSVGGIAVVDKDPVARDRIAAIDAGLVVTAELEAVAARDMVLLALHPPALKEVLPRIAPVLRPETVVVSLAPVLKNEQLTSLLGGHPCVARVIPNAPSMIGQGYNPVAYGPGLSLADRERVRSLLAPLGPCPEVDESSLEAYAVLTAMGPTYFWYQWQLLRDLGAEFGLSAQDTDVALAAMLRGATSLLFQSGLPFQVVEDTVAVKPMAQAAPEITTLVRTQLSAVHRKLTAK